MSAPYRIFGQSQAETFQAEREIVSRLLTYVGTDGRRWKDLVHKVVDDVSKEQHDVIVERLLEIDVDSFTAEDRMTVWEALQGIISRHRQFPDAKWAMPKEMMDRLQQAYERFTPEGPISQRAWLFSKTPKLLNSPARDWRARHDTLEAARLEAMRELSGQGGITLLLDFAAEMEQPGEVGFAVGKSELLDGEEDGFLVRTLASAEAAQSLFARGFVAGIFRTRGWDRVDSKLKAEAASGWSPEQRADFLSCL